VGLAVMFSIKIGGGEGRPRVGLWVVSSSKTAWRGGLKIYRITW
jgi:hypothetical protein